MIVEGIRFGDFDSVEEGLLLTNRVDEPPSERNIKETLPFMQGDYDFSRILGEAIRENRSPEYEFFIKENNRENRKMLEIKYENMLLNQGIGRLYDTASPGYYYYGKCSEANVTFDDSWQQLKLTATFDCYPYMISESREGHDIWDEINFELDVLQPVDFEVSGEKEVAIEYNGASSVAPKIITDSPFEIVASGQTINVPAGTSKNDLFRFRTGANNLLLKGNGNIRFEFYKEMI